MMNVFLSPFHNPFINLALEDAFLRGGTQLPLLFLYVNRPCVVLGRFQNPWLECQLPYLVENDVWLVRRQSGGGCVYHDEGNLNFSFITPDPMIDRRKHVELLKDAFALAHIELEISPRHDLWLDGKKISGSAFKQTKGGSFHHGTFLVNSNLSKLEESLKHTMVPKVTKSIHSVRSKVISLQEKFPHVEIPDVIEIISHYFKTTPVTLEATLLSEPLVQESFKHLSSWEWIFGETPAFTIDSLKGELNVRKGIVGDGPFSKEEMKNYFEIKDLEKLFPDFSEQHRSRNLIL
jgi:lipoate-protein ligase A